jgi:hypothetical protein
MTYHAEPSIRIMNEQIRKLIKSRHPEYESRIEHWDFLEDTYEGGRGWFEDNIYRFLKEGDREYTERVERAYRFNHTKQVVDQVDKYVFKMPILRRTEDAPDCIKRYWSRATLNGLDIDTFAKRISNATSIYGRVWIVVDSSVAAGDVVSLKDEKDAAGQVYSYIVRPQDMLDMSYDELGMLNWALVREFSRDDENPMSSSRKEVEKFRLWTRTEWTLFETQVIRGKTRYVEVDSGFHALNIVPIVQADHVFSEEFYHAPGLIEDVGYLDRAVANYLSNLDAIIQDQTFSQLAMPAQGILPGESGYDKLIEMSTKRVFTFNGEASAPFYLAPDPKQAELILSAIASIINEIYHSVGLSGERTQSNSGGNDNAASGVAKSYDFERVNSLLAAKATALQLTEQNIARMVCLYAGESKIDVETLLSYPAEFDVRSVYDEFEIAAQLTLITAPDEVRREQMRSLIKKLFPAASDKVVKLLEGSLKDWPPEMIAVAGLGAPKPAGSPSSGADSLKAANTQRVAKEMAS